LIVVDTSVLVDFFRGADSPEVDALAVLAREGTPFRIPLVCCQELLQGARTEREWKSLHDYLLSQDLLLPGDQRAAHVGAARIYFDCRRQGITLRGSIDCLVAQLALENDAVLLHSDDDFRMMASVVPLRLWDAQP